MDCVRVGRCVDRLLHSLSGAAVAAAHPDALRARSCGQTVFTVRRRAGSGQSPLSLAAGCRRYSSDALRSSGVVWNSRQARASHARDRRVDVREPKRARGAGHAPLRAIEWTGCSRPVVADAGGSRIGSRVPACGGAIDESTRAGRAYYRRRWPNVGAAMGPVCPIRLR